MTSPTKMPSSFAGEHAQTAEPEVEQLDKTAPVFGPDPEHRIVEIEPRLVAPIQHRVGVEDLQSGQQQKEQADGPCPMRDPRNACVATYKQVG